MFPVREPCPSGFLPLPYETRHGIKSSKLFLFFSKAPRRPDIAPYQTQNQRVTITNHVLRLKNPSALFEKSILRLKNSASKFFARPLQMKNGVPKTRRTIFQLENTRPKFQYTSVTLENAGQPFARPFSN
jgi:hypothetical protein